MITGLTPNSGQLRKLLARYGQAHRAYARGDFQLALRLYGRLSAELAPAFAALVAPNLGERPSGDDGDLSEVQVRRALAGMTTSGPVRRSGRVQTLAQLCAAVAHDTALLARFLAEATGHGRDTTIAYPIITAFAHALAVNPGHPPTLHNLAGYEEYLGRLEDARQHYTTALRIDGSQVASWIALGHVHAQLGNRSRAELCWQAAEEQMEGDLTARWDAAMLRLLKGDYARGWRDYEARLTFPPYLHSYGRPDLTSPMWDGRALRGALYLHGEQGAGDVVMMARYLTLARERGVHQLVLEVAKPLVRLFTAAMPDVTIVTRGDPAPAHEAQLPLLSCPAVFGTRLETIPPPFRFLAGDVALERGRVGLCWKGSPGHPHDLLRSMSWDTMRAVVDVDGFTWQSLQFGVDVEAPVDAFHAEDFADTATAIARCELVITVDTSVAHLAASMGVETWILVPLHAEWRWLQDRTDSPWYPAAKLWRQDRPGDWASVIARVGDALRTRRAEAAA